MTEELVITGPTFFSPGDETAFFRGLEHVESLADVKGQGRQLVLSFRDRPNDEEIIDLLVLFRRWQVDVGGLEKWKSDFTARHVLWHQPIFKEK